jgi:hypothetical protein
LFFVALTLSRAYIAADKDVWSSPAHIDMCQRTGQVIGELVEAGSVDNKVLWQMSDAEFWTLLRQEANPEQLRAIERLEEEGIPEANGLRLPHCAKIRTFDPDVWQGEVAGDGDDGGEALSSYPGSPHFLLDLNREYIVGEQ